MGNGTANKIIKLKSEYIFLSWKFLEESYFWARNG